MGGNRPCSTVKLISEKYPSSKYNEWFLYPVLESERQKANPKQHIPAWSIYGSNYRRPPGNRDLRSDDGDGNGNATKAIGLISKTTILHVHLSSLYISLSSLHDYDVKMPYFTFYGGRKQATTKFSFSFWTWICFLGIQLQESSPTFDKVSELQLSRWRLDEREFTF